MVLGDIGRARLNPARSRVMGQQERRGGRSGRDAEPWGVTVEQDKNPPAPSDAGGDKFT